MIAVKARPGVRRAAPVRASTGELQAFVVVGIDGGGQRIRQPIPATDESSAVRIASDLRIQVEKVLDPGVVDPFARVSQVFDDLRFYRHLERSRLQFWNDIADTIRSGGNVFEALDFAAENATEPRFRSILLTMRLDVASTKVSIDVAMRKHAEVFSAFEIDLMSLAAKSELPMAEAIDRIVLDLERDRRFRLARFALEFMPRATTGLAIFMFLLAGKFVPMIYKIPFEDHVPKPLTFGPIVTTASALSAVFFSWWSIITWLALPSAYLAIQRLLRRPDVRRAVEGVRTNGQWWSPILFPLGRIERKRNIERMCSLYAMLLASGKRNFTQATRTVAATVESQQLSDALFMVVELLESTTYSTVDAFAKTAGIVDATTIARFRAASLKGSSDGGIAGTFAKRAIAIREEIEQRDLELAKGAIQFSAAIPLSAALAAVALVVYEPITTLITNTRTF